MRRLDPRERKWIIFGIPNRREALQMNRRSPARLTEMHVENSGLPDTRRDFRAADVLPMLVSLPAADAALVVGVR
jgi:hypothetical protein